MNMIKSTSKQNAMIGYLVTRLKLDSETKEELIYTHTDGRTTSIRGLSKQEAAQVITSLSSGHNVEQSPAAKMRRKILSMAHELNWKLPGGRIDMQHVNDWCSTYGYLKKDLDRYTESELPTLVTQFEAAYLTHLKKV